MLRKILDLIRPLLQQSSTFDTLVARSDFQCSRWRWVLGQQSRITGLSQRSGVFFTCLPDATITGEWSAGCGYASKGVVRGRTPWFPIRIVRLGRHSYHGNGRAASRGHLFMDKGHPKIAPGPSTHLPSAHAKALKVGGAVSVGLSPCLAAYDLRQVLTGDPVRCQRCQWLIRSS